MGVPNSDLGFVQNKKTDLARSDVFFTVSPESCLVLVKSGRDLCLQEIGDGHTGPPPGNELTRYTL